MLNLRLLAFFILHQKLLAPFRREIVDLSQAHREVPLLDDPLIEATEDDGINNERTKLFHEIKCQRGATVAVGVQVPTVGIKTQHIRRGMHIVRQQRIAKAEEGIDRISRGASHPLGEGESFRLDELIEYSKVGRRAFALMATQDRQFVRSFRSALRTTNSFGRAIDIETITIARCPQCSNLLRSVRFVSTYAELRSPAP